MFIFAVASQHKHVVRDCTCQDIQRVETALLHVRLQQSDQSFMCRSSSGHNSLQTRRKRVQFFRSSKMFQLAITAIADITAQSVNSKNSDPPTKMMRVGTHTQIHKHTRTPTYIHPCIPSVRPSIQHLHEYVWARILMGVNKVGRVDDAARSEVHIEEVVLGNC